MVRFVTTKSPDSAWVIRQDRNFQKDAENLDLPATIVMRDNDWKYSKQYDAVFENGGVKIKRNTPLSPNLRAHVERFIQSLKHERLDAFVFVSQRLLDHICRDWAIHDNRERSHEACDHLSLACESPPEIVETTRPRDFMCTILLAGVCVRMSGGRLE